MMVIADDGGDDDFIDIVSLATSPEIWQVVANNS